MSKVSILCGGISSEDYLSRRSAEYLYPYILELGYCVEILDWNRKGTVSRLDKPNGLEVESWKSINACLLEYRDGIVFNLLHGEQECAGQLQGCFQLLNIPFTGNSLASSVVGMDKMLSKDLFRRLNLLTPGDLFVGYIFQLNTADSLNSILSNNFSYPFMLKCSHGGSSEGVALIEDDRTYYEVLESWKSNPTVKYTPIFAEEYIEGTEYCLGLFGHWSDKITSLPIAKIDYDGKYFNKDIKERNLYSSCFDFQLEKSIADQILKAGYEVHRVLKFTGFSRLDVIVDKNSKVYVIEVNTHPGMGDHSIIPNMIKNCEKFDIKDSLVKIINWAESAGSKK